MTAAVSVRDGRESDVPALTSVALHRKFGFREVGVFDEYAVKHGLYLSSVWLQKTLDA